MSKAKSSTGGRTFTIISSMASNGVMTVRETTTGETYEVVDYIDEIVRERLASREAGRTVSLELTPVEGCTNICRVTRFQPGGLPEPGL